jgi:hypothetical protein
MPVAQFKQFEKLDKPIMHANGTADAVSFWISSVTSETGTSTE